MGRAKEHKQKAVGSGKHNTGGNKKNNRDEERAKRSSKSSNKKGNRQEVGVCDRFRRTRGRDLFNFSKQRISNDDLNDRKLFPFALQQRFNTWAKKTPGQQREHPVKLNLSNNDIGNVGVISLMKLLKNTSITTSSQQGGKKKPSGFHESSASYLDTLVALNLACNNIEDVGVNSIADVLATQTSMRLRELNLSWNDIGEDGGEVLASALRHNTSVTFLNLSRNVIKHAAGSLLALAFATRSITRTRYVSPRFRAVLEYTDEPRPHIRVLLLKDNKITGEDIKLPLDDHTTIQNPPWKNSKLEELNMDSNLLGLYQGAFKLGELLKRNKSLQILSIGNNNLQDLGVQYLTKALFKPFVPPGMPSPVPKNLFFCSSLTQLNLHTNNIGTQGCFCIYQFLRRLTHNMTRISLASNNIDDEGAYYLSLGLRSQNNRRLEGFELDLRNNSIGNRGAWKLCRALQKNRHIGWIELFEEGNRDITDMKLKDTIITILSTRKKQNMQQKDEEVAADDAATRERREKAQQQERVAPHEEEEDVNDEEEKEEDPTSEDESEKEDESSEDEDDDDDDGNGSKRHFNSSDNNVYATSNNDSTSSFNNNSIEYQTIFIKGFSVYLNDDLWSIIFSYLDAADLNNLTLASKKLNAKWNHFELFWERLCFDYKFLSHQHHNYAEDVLEGIIPITTTRDDDDDNDNNNNAVTAAKYKNYFRTRYTYDMNMHSYDRMRKAIWSCTGGRQLLRQPVVAVPNIMINCDPSLYTQSTALLGGDTSSSSRSSSSSAVPLIEETTFYEFIHSCIAMTTSDRHFYFPLIQDFQVRIVTAQSHSTKIMFYSPEYGMLTEIENTANFDYVPRLTATATAAAMNWNLPQDVPVMLYNPSRLNRLFVWPAVSSSAAASSPSCDRGQNDDGEASPQQTSSTERQDDDEEYVYIAVCTPPQEAPPAPHTGGREDDDDEEEEEPNKEKEFICTRYFRVKRKRYVKEWSYLIRKMKFEGA